MFGKYNVISIMINFSLPYCVDFPQVQYITCNSKLSSLFSVHLVSHILSANVSLE